MNAARIRKNEKVIALAASINETEYPQIRFHKSCRSMFSMKRDLEKLQKEHKKLKEKIQCRRSGRSASGTSRECGKLEEECICCRRVKYLKGDKTRETLSSCSMFTTDEKIKKANTIRNDCKMMVLSAEDLIAKEPHYHATCYRSYTLVNYNKDNGEAHMQEDAENDDQEAFEHIS